MAKNNKLINSLKEIAARNRGLHVEAAEENMTPHVYAAIALALYDRGWRHKRINRLFVESQHIWQDYIATGEEKSMVQICEEKTGILLLNPEQAQRREENC